MRSLAAPTILALAVLAACGADEAAAPTATAEPTPTDTAEPSPTDTAEATPTDTAEPSPTADRSSVPVVSTTAEPAPTAESPEPTDAVDGPLVRHPQPPPDVSIQLAAEIRGVLELDGDCLYVRLDEVDERYPVVWPAGTAWDEQDRSVIAPSGERMRVGDEVYGGGGYFAVRDVRRDIGPDAATVARDCVDNRYGEIAIVNNHDTAIGPADGG